MASQRQVAPPREAAASPSRGPIITEVDSGDEADAEEPVAAAAHRPSQRGQRQPSQRPAAAAAAAAVQHQQQEEQEDRKVGGLGWIIGREGSCRPAGVCSAASPFPSSSRLTPALPHPSSKQTRGRKRSGRAAPSKLGVSKKTRGGAAASGMRGMLFSMQVSRLG